MLRVWGAWGWGWVGAGVSGFGEGHMERRAVTRGV